jgi:ATP-binding cassette subfamily B protein
VAPEVALWNDTLLENLWYGSSHHRAGEAGGPPPPAPIEALRSAGLLDLVARLPAGLQTLLGEAGGRLSGGEAQRLRLARALLRPGVRLALLDEPFRGLPPCQRRDLLAAARDRWRQATLLCITHSPVEALDFDHLLILDAGRLVERGRPADLAGRQGSLYGAMLAAEAAVEATLRGPGWRRLHLDGGRILAAGLRDERAAFTSSPPDGIGPPAAAPWGGRGAADATPARDDRGTAPPPEIRR